jgi:hypothetical protein
MASHWPFGRLQPKLWAKEGPGVIGKHDNSSGCIEASGYGTGASDASAESWPQGLNLTLLYSTSDNSIYYVALYFVKIDPLAQNKTRVFDIVVNQGPSEDYYPNISVVSLAGGMCVATELVNTTVTFNSSSGSIQLIPNADSQLGPILNALELFVLTPLAPNLTFVSDGK